MKPSSDSPRWDTLPKSLPPPPKKRGQVQSLESHKLSSSLWHCLRQPLSGWAQPHSLPGAAAGAAEVGSSPRGVLSPATASAASLQPLWLLLTTSPSCLTQPVALTEGSFPRWCYSNGTIPAPQPLGLINGLSARADTQVEVNEAFTSPQLLWGLALQTGSRPPQYASYAPRGSPEAVSQPDTSVDVVLGGTLAC